MVVESIEECANDDESRADDSRWFSISDFVFLRKSKFFHAFSPIDFVVGVFFVTLTCCVTRATRE